MHLDRPIMHHVLLSPITSVHAGHLAMTKTLHSRSVRAIPLTDSCCQFIEEDFRLISMLRLGLQRAHRDP